MLREIPFYDELSVVKTSKALKGYARSYNIEKINSKDPSVQFAFNKPSTEDLFKDLLDKIKGFKCQITLKVLLSKYKENTDKVFATVYFNSTPKAVISPKYGLEKSFQEVLIGLIIGLVKDLDG